MTHDELLQRVFNVSVSPKREVVPDELGEALIAVLTLHAPITEDFTDSPFNHEPDHQDFVDFCTSCEDTVYPCETIKIIELNLQ